MTWRSLCPREAAVLIAAGCLLLPGCLGLPGETGPVVAIDTVDPGELRELLALDNLGICSEEGWSGEVLSMTTTDVAVTLGVVFSGLGSEELGTGSTSLHVPGQTTVEFTIVPDPPIDDLVLTCMIDITEIVAQ
ncbi:hypothetical protein [Candidatus Poriferisodalis sp.]|uniref:hypothetical protein n=1 Tax=Candidatus Poriferisodalis sp. TaxID=3101277 RepID=UPI003B5B90E0